MAGAGHLDPDRSDAAKEEARLAALRRYEILDSPPESAFDDLTALAATICEVPIALVSLVDEHRQWFKSRRGLDACQTPREVAFCAHAIRERALFVVPDAAADPLFRTNPLVTGEPHVRFYAGAPLLTADGHALGTLCVIDRRPRTLTASQRDALLRLARQVVDQLELRRAYAAREREQFEARAVLEAVSEGIYGVDAAGCCTFANAACVRMLGYERAEQLVGQEMHALVHHTRADGSVHPLEECPLRRALAEGRSVRSDDELLFRADGSSFHAILSASVRPDGKGGRAAVVTIVDVTERQRVEAALAEEGRMRERILGIVGHDIRNPLSAVSHAALLLELRGQLPPEAQRHVAIVRRSAKRIAVLVEDLLDFVRARQGQGIPIKPAVADLAVIARTVATELQTAQPARVLLVEAPSPVVGTWDAGRLEQLVSNLAGNALQHGAKDQPVHIRVERRGERAIVAVTNGGTIAPEVRGSLFDPFRRGSGGVGLGLGLYIVDQIARAHGGAVEVACDDERTKFTVTLPAG